MSNSIVTINSDGVESVTICGVEFTDPKIIHTFREAERQAERAERILRLPSATGTIRTYVDPLGREQRAVEGPNGTYLVTRDNEREPYLVWKSDSIDITYRTSDPVVALEKALKAAGVEI